MSSWESVWKGDDIIDRVKRAQARAVVGIGELAAQEAKRLAHVYTGTMRRSIHVAPTGYAGYQDESVARGGSEIGSIGPDEVTFGYQYGYTQVDGATVELGSWVSYASIEEVDRGHEFISPAVEAVRTMAEEVLIRAAQEEGLS